MPKWSFAPAAFIETPLACPVPYDQGKTCWTYALNNSLLHSLQGNTGEMVTWSKLYQSVLHLCIFHRRKLLLLDCQPCIASTYDHLSIFQICPEMCIYRQQPKIVIIYTQLIQKHLSRKLPKFLISITHSTKTKSYVNSQIHLGEGIEITEFWQIHYNFKSYIIIVSPCYKNKHFRFRD